jgi:hypothetical protein
MLSIDPTSAVSHLEHVLSLCEVYTKLWAFLPTDVRVHASSLLHRICFLLLFWKRQALGWREPFCTFLK